jgi:hypothetical protein
MTLPQPNDQTSDQAPSTEPNSEQLWREWCRELDKPLHFSGTLHSDYLDKISRDLEVPDHLIDFWVARYAREHKLLYDKRTYLFKKATNPSQAPTDTPRNGSGDNSQAHDDGETRKAGSADQSAAEPDKSSQRQKASEQASSSRQGEPGSQQSSGSQKGNNNGQPERAVYCYEELLNAQLEPPNFIVEGLMVENQEGFLVGRFGIGKTMLGLQLGFCLATGRDFVGRKVPRPCKVAFFDGENGSEAIQSRIARQHAALRPSEEEMTLLNNNWQYVDCQIPSEDGLQWLKLDQAGFRKLEKFVIKHQCEVLIFDNFGRFFAGDETEEQKIKEFFDSLAKLRNKHDSLKRGSILFQQHPIKPPRENHMPSLLANVYEYLSCMRGSGRLLDFAANRLALTQEYVTGENERFYVLNGIIRGQIAPLILEFNSETFLFELYGDKDFVAKRVYEHCRRQLDLFKLLPRDRAKFTFTEVLAIKDQDGKGFSRDTVNTTLHKAHATCSPVHP